MSDIIIPTLSVVAIADVVLGLIVVSRSIRSVADIIFGCITFTLVIWSIAIIGFYSPDYQSLANWISITHSSALLISFFFLIFSIYFPRKLFTHKIILLPLVVLLSLLYLIFFTDSVIGGTNGLSYQLGGAYLYYAFSLTLFFLIGFVILLIQFKKSSSIVERQQIKYVLAGYLISSVLAIVPDLIFPYFNIFKYTWFGPLFALILVASLFIAIFKYRLFQVKIILTEIISISIITALLIELFFINSTSELILKTVVLIIVSIFSYILIRGVYREIRQRERIELLASDLQKANSRLTELDRQKSEFVSFATHQLRAPLTAMRGYASLLLEGDMGKLEDITREGVSRIYESTKTLVTIVDDYLNISRIELGTMKYSFETLDMKKLVEDVIAEIKPNIEKAKLTFSFKAEEAADLRVNADRDKLKQVVVNLIDNAVKYTPSGTIEVTLARDRAKNKIVFMVKDNGIGIAPEILPKLFQKFSRAQNANKVNIKGTGLGLYVAKEMVEAHHGTIRAESEGEGKGSRFIVELEPGVK